MVTGGYGKLREEAQQQEEWRCLTSEAVSEAEQPEEKEMPKHKTFSLSATFSASIPSTGFHKTPQDNPSNLM